MRTNDKSRFFRRAATGTSALALATALAASPAHAQSATPSYNAPDPTVVSGTVTFDRGQTTPGLDIYNVQSPTAVLDFTPNDTTGTGVINFQNAGTTAIYQGGSNFTVLNRIVPTDPSRAVQFNGTVRSLVNSAPGGSVWFYSPGGIIAGSSAVFDVGSLLLSTGDPTQGTGTIGSTTSFGLSSANSNAAVTIQPGAQITASPEGSYIALVAPVVNQNGSVRVNGSAAYVAAEQATLSINQGLFDISVAVGSDGGGTPLTHNGTTTGPASTGGGDNQGIFMVAVPKNTAITMLIAPSGQLGFDVAGGATVENGAIYLQAGGNLSVDTTETIVNRIADLPQSSLGASIQIDSGNITSPIAAQASRDLLITAGTSPGITLAGDGYFYGANQVHLVANTNGLFTADKSVVLNSFGAVPGTAQIDALAGSTMTFADLDIRADTLSGRFFTSAVDPSTGGTAALRATGGTINVNGNLELSAIGSSPAAVSTFGGSADISVNGGAITVAANTSIDVSASTSGAALTTTAGQATAFANGGGALKFNNGLSLNATGGGMNGASGKGGSGFVVTGAGGGSIEAVTMNLSADGIGGSGLTGIAGSGSGGSVLIQTQDTTATSLIKTGDAFLSAVASGGDASSSATVAGGAAAGGVAQVLIGANGSFTATSSTSLEASAEGGSGGGSGNGGQGQGGSARVNAAGGTIQLGSSLDLIASGDGGSGSGTGNGGTGIGGEARLGTFNGSTASNVTVTGDVQIDVSGNGGFASSGKGGDGLGGVPADLDNGPFDKGAYVSAIGGTVSVSGVLDMDASGNGGSGGNGGGAGTGGLTDIIVFNAAIDLPGVVSLDSSGNGGDGLGSGAAGGTGTGGNSLISATSGGDSLGGGVVPTGLPGSITLGSLFQFATGQGGDGGTGTTGAAGGIGGNGFGGVTNLVAQAGSGTLTVGDVTMEISGLGGEGGVGGAASSSGGSGGNGGRGGDGTGGFTNFGTVSGPGTTNNDGSATMGNVQVTVFGSGGTGGDGMDGGNGGAGGTGTGGTATLLSRGSPVVTQSVSLLGFAVGGNGGAGATLGAGGDAIGGSVGFLATNRFQRTERGSYQGTSFSASAFTQGGTGSTTGASTAGQVIAQVTQADVTLDSLSLFTFGTNPAAAGSESSLLVDAGTLNVGTSLDVSTVGDFRFGAVNGGALTTSSLQFTATGSLLPPVSGTPGTIDVTNGFFADFGGDFVTTSNFTTTSFFQVSAGGQLQVGDVTSGGNVSLSATGGTLTAGNIVATQGISLDGQAGVSVGNLSTETGYGSITINSGEGDVATGNIRSADSVLIFASGDIAAGDITAGLGDQSLVFGGVEIGASGAIDLGNIQAASVDIFTDEGATAPFGGIRTGSITAEAISVDGLGDVTTGNLKTGDFYSGIDSSSDDFLIGVASTGNVSVGTVETPTSVGLASRNGSVTAGNISVGDSVLVLAKTNITTGGIAAATGAGNNVFLSNISVLETDPVFEGFQTLDDFSFFDPTTLGGATPTRVDGLITLTGPVSTGGFAAAATNGFNTGSIIAANRLLLDSGASLSLGDLTTNQALSLTSGGALSVGNVQATSVDLNAADSVTAGAIAASGEVNVNAGSFASFAGQVSGTEINVTSNDLRLGPSGGLGTTATTQLRLNAQAVSQVTLGGSGADGYSIDATEAQGLRAQRIDLVTGAPVTIATLSLNGSGAGTGANLIGDSGQLTIDTESGIRVTGAFTMVNAGAGDRLTLRATDRIAVATDSGGMIALTGSGSGSLGGTLELVGNSIAVGTGGLLDQLAANPNFPGRNSILAAPGNSPNQASFIQANRLELSAANLIAIQNSGSAEQAAGFTAGSGGMQINSRGSQNAPLDVFIFGRVADSSGAFKINDATLAAITLSTGEGSGGFSPTSAVNNCVVGGSACEAPPPPTPPVQEMIVNRIPASIADVVQGSLSSAADPESVAALPTVTLITTIDTGQLRTDPVISDPVSGGGNPSLWETPGDQNDPRDGDSTPAPRQGGDK